MPLPTRREDIIGSPRTDMERALAAYHYIVLSNIRLRRDGDDAKEYAIALFRCADCLLPPDPNR